MFISVVVCSVLVVFKFLLVLCNHLSLLCREETFRRELQRNGEVRSLMPPSVNMMALTATAKSFAWTEMSICSH